jgi:hypothetical protein
MKNMFLKTVLEKVLVEFFWGGVFMFTYFFTGKVLYVNSSIDLGQPQHQPVLQDGRPGKNYHFTVNLKTLRY